MSKAQKINGFGSVLGLHHSRPFREGRQQNTDFLLYVLELINKFFDSTLFSFTLYILYYCGLINHSSMFTFTIHVVSYCSPVRRSRRGPKYSFPETKQGNSHKIIYEAKDRSGNIGRCFVYISVTGKV